ncbi:PAS domain S-box protein [Cytobacillus kochii]|uniref:PAS domain S-box protein n=1 Tax=Cytobacillus TaxID=2675230 RepID=UPI00278A06FB|nr:PAS domain S-box protein [Cytobacillus kochii]MDQ0186510.1 PAS domain S-box-containing protein [Cytobacillus kochii]
MKTKFLIFFFLGSIIWVISTNLLIREFHTSSNLISMIHIKEILYISFTTCLFYYFIKRIEELNTSKEDKERLSTLINAMVDFVNFKDEKGRWIEANKVALELFNLEEDQYRGKTDIELGDQARSFYKNSFAHCMISDEETWDSGKIARIEENILQPDGTKKIFDTIKVPLFHEDRSRKGLVIIGRDISEKKRLDELLQESQQQYKSLFLYSQDMIVMMDLSGRITQANPQFKEITGYQPEEVLQQPITHLFPKDLHDEVFKSLEHIRQTNQHIQCEMAMNHKNGPQIILECTAVPMIINNKQAGIICYGKDVTKLRLAEEQLRKTEKLSVVGELSASVAHEIRNPLTSLKGFVQVLTTEDSKHEFYYRIMEEELDRINHIVSELLLLAKPQEIKFIQADIFELLHNVISLLKTEASLHNIQIQLKSYLRTQISILCEPNQLKQLFINLIKNAIEASTDGDGQIMISLEKEEDTAIIKISDNGDGMSPELLTKLGEPFYSSKEKGTGLGLTVSNKIVQSHNGSIHFSSILHEGTTVTVKLPIQIASRVPVG